MKTLFLLFFLFFGISVFSFAQMGNIAVAPEWVNKKLPTQPETDFRNHLFLDSSDTILLDSAKVYFPEEFLLNRELNLSGQMSPIQREVSLPFIELQPLQSRMPIIPFDESVNYTILKREFN